MQNYRRSARVERPEAPASGEIVALRSSCRPIWASLLTQTQQTLALCVYPWTKLFAVDLGHDFGCLHSLLTNLEQRSHLSAKLSTYK